MTVHLRAAGVEVDNDDGRYVLVFEIDEGNDLRVDIHDDVLAFYASVRREIGPYAAEADQARADIATGTFSVRAEILSALADQRGPQPVTSRPVSVEDAVEAGYALDDPKSPGYHDRMVD